MASYGSRKTPENNSMVVLDRGAEITNQRCETGGARRKYFVQRENSSSSLEFLPPEDDHHRRKKKNVLALEESESWQGSSSNSRPSSSGGRFPPPLQRPDSSSSRRTPTPTKQISLQAVRRKDNGDQSFEHLDWKTENNYEVGPAATNNYSRRNELRHSAEKTRPKNVYKASSSQLGLNDASETEKANKTKTSESQAEEANKPSTSKTQHSHQNKIEDIDDSDAFDTDLEEGDESNSEEEEEPPKAPNELLMEFVTAVMTEDYANAKKLCTMVLMYEPEHPEALKFQPLIDEKIRLEEEMANAETDSEEETDSDDDDDDDDSEDEDDDSDEDSSEDEDDSGDDNYAEKGKGQIYDPGEGSSSNIV